MCIITDLTPFIPAATIFWKISSQRSGTGKRKVWNSPELRRVSQAMSPYKSNEGNALQEHALSVDPEAVVVPLHSVS